MSYYEKRIADLEARVAQLAREQRLKAIPVEGKLLERYALMQAENSRLKAEVEHLTSENLLVREEADRYCRLWQEAKEGKQS